MEVNAKGAFLGTKAVIPHMRRAGVGSIINISSGAGLVGQSWAAAYNASKAAVHLLAKSTQFNTPKKASEPTRFIPAPSTPKCSPRVPNR